LSKLPLNSAASSSKESAFVAEILAWGEKNRRDFAWRHTKDPYRVFVAESLVQRTKAAQAEPAYLNFLERWPNLWSLSRATPRELRSVIGTLGLDYRSKRIITVARQIAETFDGRIPNRFREMKKLYGKGLGDYMAHAILCFAFGQAVAVVDKNVERILKRVFSLAMCADAHRDPRLWAFAGRLVPSRRAREYNWSLLDFGALMCTPKNPKCPTCPLLQLCDFGGGRMRRSNAA
jgi:A/G-specific adenine glycosylase